MVCPAPPRPHRPANSQPRKPNNGLFNGATLWWVLWCTGQSSAHIPQRSNSFSCLQPTHTHTHTNRPLLSSVTDPRPFKTAGKMFVQWLVLMKNIINPPQREPDSNFVLWERKEKSLPPLLLSETENLSSSSQSLLDRQTLVFAEDELMFFLAECRHWKPNSDEYVKTQATDLRPVLFFQQIWLI